MDPEVRQLIISQLIVIVLPVGTLFARLDLDVGLEG